MADRLVRQPQDVQRLRLARTYGRSPSVVLGRVPAERHEHYDADDRLTGYTLVIREPEFTDDDRARMLALEVYERGICECGFHEDLTEPEQNFYQIETRTCPVCAGTARAKRVQNEADEKIRKRMGENAPPATPDPADGRRTFVRPLTGAELERRRLSDFNRA